MAGAEGNAIADPGPFDLAIVGGGIVGVCAARDAALRGLRVVLLEREDLASGTTGASLSIVHGGLRQLGNLALTDARTSAREQRAWLDIARHRVSPLEVVVPARSRRHACLLRTAAAAGRRLLPTPDLSAAEDPGDDADRADRPAQRFPRYLRSLETRRLGIRGLPGRFGSLILLEARVDSLPRLTVDLAVDAAERGVDIRVRSEFASGRFDAANGVWWIEARDTLDPAAGASHLRARYLINAAGAAVEQVANRAGLDTSRLPKSWVLGVNLVVRRDAPERGFGVPIRDSAGAKRVSSGRRYLFVMPAAGGHTAIGTGYYASDDVASGSGPQAAAFAAHAAERFRHTVNAAIPAYGIRDSEVVQAVAGWLPSDPARPRHPLSSDIAVEHPASTSIVGVKFTTARWLAERAVDRCASAIGRGAAASRSAEVRLPGAPAAPDGSGPDASGDGPPRDSNRRRPGSPQPRQESGELSLTPPETARIESIYGVRTPDVIEAMQTWPDWREPVIDDLVYGVFRYGAEFEWARTAADLTRRRTLLAAEGRVTQRVDYLARRATGGGRSDPQQPLDRIDRDQDGG